MFEEIDYIKMKNICENNKAVRKIVTDDIWTDAQDTMLIKPMTNVAQKLLENGVFYKFHKLDDVDFDDEFMFKVKKPESEDAPKLKSDLGLKTTIDTKNMLFFFEMHKHLNFNDFIVASYDDEFNNQAYTKHFSVVFK